MTDLLTLTAELVETPSVSRHERALATLVEDRLRPCSWLTVDRVGDNVVARTNLGRAHRLVVAGHLDTVPPARDDAVHVEDGVLFGLGAADMKGGLAVMLDLALTTPEPSVDVTWCFYAREEIQRSQSGVLELWEKRPDLLQADAAVLGEPTDCRVEAGCQGTMRVVVRLGGCRAHTARPSTGVNAIHRLGAVLTLVEHWPGRSVALDGCRYTEQLQAVAVSGGVAPNVVPDEATVTLNYRYAPDRTARQAEKVLRELLEGVLEPEYEDSLEVADEADGALPELTHPVLAALVSATGQPPRAKVGWTDVASFAAHGIPATNFGPGDPLLAHHPREHVTRELLERARSTLSELLVDPSLIAAAAP